MSIPDSHNSSAEEKLQVVIDCDAGADDALAIFALLAGEANKEVVVHAITCVHGNTNVENVCVNVLQTLQTADRLDIPVYCGAHEPLIDTGFRSSHPFHGKNGFGDVAFPSRPDISLAQKENATEALNRIVSDNKGQINLICLAPLTNIALTLRTYHNFAANLKEIFIMGGNYKGVGNTTSSAEFNFYSDPEAAHLVLQTAKCPITLLPWEASLKANVPLDWRFNELGKFNTPHIQLLNQIEASIYKKNKSSEWCATDAIVPAIFLRPTIITRCDHCHLSVELQGMLTRGQVVVDHLRTDKNRNKPNVKIVKDVSCEQIKQFLLWVGGTKNFKC